MTLAFAGLSFAQSAPAAQPAAVQPAAVANSEVVAPRGATTTLDEMIQAKLDSMDRKKDPSVKVNSDSLAKAKADSIRRLIREGKYVQRARYDKSNFDHWKVDTVFQKSMKAETFGVWRTPIVAHGHAFRDAELRFGMNDTLYGVTRTYSDSGRYQKTGEYTYKARYRFDNDSSLVTREVFLDREVIRWDYILFHIKGDTLKHNLKKLEFRDLNDNWLNALQGFENIPPEIYIRDKSASDEMAKEYEQSKGKKKK
ncbi:MAG: hypothetical protein II121_00675 [Fibrobacter sp.]|uniref:hypothetical protein n=1 Tax=uncultured Fibrobacter sp. TaxID=261512 RepID=UPI001566593C|nr:hypothetical protein [uncultured Fibrobacter sp.]MBQ1823644.1 hypothetical protein [Fibrobacter sp.]